jgi:meromycolic acid enoyl-[acyl-carrier-protein] reductase
VTTLAGRRLLITGVITHRSIAFAVAEEAQRQGAEVLLTSFGRARRLTERAAKRLPVVPDVLELDVNSPEDLAALAGELERRWGRVDGVLHAIANAPADALGGDFLDTPAESAEATFRTSAYSLSALVAVLRPLLGGSEGGDRSSGPGAPISAPADAGRAGASVVGLDFDASVAWPAYDWMGVAKAALESVSRYLARDLGPAGVRVNLVAAGPIRTAAAGGIPGFDELAGLWARRAPLAWDVDDPAPVAAAVCFLLSDAARAITGEILHVDGGAHAIGA